MNRLLLRKGRLVDPGRDLDRVSDILLDDGFIVAIGDELDGTGAEIIDVEGLVVAPGFIDIHVHLREPGFEYKETIASGCAAAVAGGFTAICPMPNTKPANDCATTTQYILARATQAKLCRVYPIGAVSKGQKGEELAEIGSMVAAGAVAISDDGYPVSNAQLMRRALEYAKSFDIPLAAHEEDLDLAAGGVMHEGEVSTRIGLRGIPAAAEDVFVARDVLLAELTGGRLHICHTSTRRSFDLVREAKARGLKVTCEVAPHHFLLTDENVASSNYDSDWKMHPPLREAADVEAAIAAIVDGTVDAIATDHAPHHADEKALDFELAPNGIVGLETCVSLCLDRLVRSGIIELPTLIDLLSCRPATIFGLPGGRLELGAPADITVLDLENEVVVDPQRFASKGRNTPFGGWKLKGSPSHTIVAGRVVWSCQQALKE